MQDTITCVHCGRCIGPHWEVFEHVRCSRQQTLQEDAERLHRRFEERASDLRLLGSGITVRRANHVD